jgi:MFS family permease
MFGPKAKSALEAYTAHHHLRASLGLGMVAGAFVLNEYVARKGLDASRWHLVALLLLPALVQSVAGLWNPATRDGVIGRRPFRLLGIPGRLLLLVFLLVPVTRSATPFVLIVALATVAEILLLPAQNAIVASNYPAETRGRWFGLVTAVHALGIIVVSVPAGKLLDAYPDAWPWLMAFAGLVGAWGYANWAKLRRRRVKRAADVPDLPEFGSAIEVLRKDKAFLAFELCFMTYGTGFLMLMPVLPIYLVDEMGISYGQVGFARGLLFWLAMIVAGPVFGRLSDRIGILRSAAGAFLLLAGFPLVLLFAPGLAGVNVGFALFGIAMAGVHVAWNLGPIALARGRDPLPYLNAHVSLVGLRALIGMVGGSLLQEHFGSRPVFWTVLALEILAAAGMLATAVGTRRRWTVRT